MCFAILRFTCLSFFVLCTSSGKHGTQRDEPPECTSHEERAPILECGNPNSRQVPCGHLTY